jgi:hypothetical protein
MKYLMLCGCALFALSGLSQEVISTQGDSYSNATANIDFTIGETVIETVSDGSYDLTQGFHQTHWYFAGVDDFSPQLSLEVFPNPVSNDLFVRGECPARSRYALIDAQGKRVMEGGLEANETQIVVQGLAPGAYTLQVRTEDMVLKNFKLVKHQ